MSEEQRGGAGAEAERGPEREPEAVADAVETEADASAAVDSAGEAATEAAAEAAAEEGAQEDALAAAVADAALMKDAALRAQAEVENVRRRATRDVEAAHKFALEKFASALLPVADGLQKSVEAVTAHEGDDEGLAAVKEGIQLSERMFMDTLEKFGVEGIDPLGEPFDPERHEAMSMIEAPAAEANSVVNVLQKGFALNGRLLRAAMVIVAK